MSDTLQSGGRRGDPPVSVFADLRDDVYNFQYAGRIRVGTLVGGTPTDLKKAESWLRTKFEDKDDVIRAKAAEIMEERGLKDLNEATAAVVADSHLNGFKRDENGLYIEGRQLKAAIKEAANVRWPKDRWGPSRKGTQSFFAEHVFVPETRLHLGVTEPTNVHQRFVHTWRGSGIQYEEYVDDAEFNFTVITDFDFESERPNSWAQLWLTGEQQGIGATRSQGFGRYEVIAWDRVK